MKIFVGYDPKEDDAYKVCAFSLKKLNNKLDIIPVIKDNLSVYNRPVDPLSSTEFTFTRFLVPYLCDYKGWALFCDCDFVWLDDPINLLSDISDQYAAMVVKHNFVPKSKLKMDNREQHQYPRKNWSSMVLWNCAHPSNKSLTPDLINTATGQYLHRFQWLQDYEIGEIDKEWNWLVGYYTEPKDGRPKALHYTEGGPWLNEYKNCSYSYVWNHFAQIAQITK
jgi:hypothetical protein